MMASPRLLRVPPLRTVRIHSGMGFPLTFVASLAPSLSLLSRSPADSRNAFCGIGVQRNVSSHRYPHHAFEHTVIQDTRSTTSVSKPTWMMVTRSRQANRTNHPKRHLAAERELTSSDMVSFAELKADVRTKREDVEGPVIDADGKVYLKSMTLEEMEHWVTSTLGHKPYRARQLWKWLYKTDRWASSFDEMTDLAKPFRQELQQLARIDALSIDSVHKSQDGTRKMTFRLASGGVIETVLIPAEGRTTLCVSSQWGCALNCQFCLTGRGGFKGHLNQAEIVDQVVLARRFFESESHISNIVFMGEGEPLHNINNVLRAVDVILHKDGLNFSHNKVTVSTSGLVPEIRRFAQESKANIAVSLHATNDEVRSWIMPINRKYPLKELMGALRDEFPRHHVRQAKVFFEYVMLKGVNDSLQDAKELLRLVAGVPCKINLIHFNPHEGTEFQASPQATMYAFQDFLVNKGLTVTVRQSRGDDKMMACGQLGQLGPTQAPRMRVPDRFAHTVRRVPADSTGKADPSAQPGRLARSKS